MNGPRNAQEFVCGGEVQQEPGRDESTEKWSRFVFLEENRQGVTDEWWCHAPSSFWFIARRDRASDTILEAWTVADYFDRVAQR